MCVNICIYMYIYICIYIYLYVFNCVWMFECFVSPYRTNDSHSSPFAAAECERNVLNLFDEFPIAQLEAALELAANHTSEEIRENILNFLLWLEELNTVNIQPCQHVLFDLPFYYVGG